MGPLAGVKVLEFEAIGPAPLRDWGFGKDDAERLRSLGLRYRER